MCSVISISRVKIAHVIFRLFLLFDVLKVGVVSPRFCNADILFFLVNCVVKSVYMDSFVFRGEQKLIFETSFCQWKRVPFCSEYICVINLSLRQLRNGCTRSKFQPQVVKRAGFSRLYKKTPLISRKKPTPGNEKYIIRDGKRVVFFSDGKKRKSEVSLSSPRATESDEQFTGRHMSAALFVFVVE